MPESGGQWIMPMKEANLGVATTRELLGEIRARLYGKHEPLQGLNLLEDNMSEEELEYRTWGSNG